MLIAVAFLLVTMLDHRDVDDSYHKIPLDTELSVNTRVPFVM